MLSRRKTFFQSLRLYQNPTSSQFDINFPAQHNNAVILPAKHRKVKKK